MVGVLLVEDNEDLRDSVADLLRLWDARPVALRSLAEVEAHAAEALACDLAILDINLGPGVPSGIGVYRWLRERRFGGRIVFLTGHARSHPLVAEALRLDDVRVFDKPIEAQILRRLVAGEPS